MLRKQDANINILTSTTQSMLVIFNSLTSNAKLKLYNIPQRLNQDDQNATIINT